MLASLKTYGSPVAAVFVVGVIACVPTAAQSDAVGRRGTEWVIPLIKRSPDESSTSSTTNKAPEPRVWQIPLQKQDVKVPECLNKTWAQAEQLLEDDKLAAKALVADVAPTDIVQAQDIPAGTRVKKGTKVGLRLAVVVPHVIGETIGEAYRRMHDEKGFAVRYDRQLPASIVVTRQRPEGDTLLPRGAETEIACLVKVPDVTNSNVRRAYDVVRAETLQPRFQRYVQEADVVYSQSPRPGTEVPALSTVTLVPGVRVPYLLGPSNVADARLAQCQLSGQIVSRREVPTQNPVATSATIEWQSVRPGTVVPRDRTILLRAFSYRYVPATIIIVGGKDSRCRDRTQSGGGGMGMGGDRRGDGFF